MSYLIQSRLADDTILPRRIAACAATVGVPDPTGWAYSKLWTYSAQEGWVAAYGAAEKVSDEPGASEDHITDAMILSATTAILASEAEGA